MILAVEWHNDHKQNLMYIQALHITQGDVAFDGSFFLANLKRRRKTLETCEQKEGSVHTSTSTLFDHLGFLAIVQVRPLHICALSRYRALQEAVILQHLSAHLVKYLRDACAGFGAAL